MAVLQAIRVLWDKARDEAAKTQIQQAEALRADLDTREAAIDLRQGELAQKESAFEQTRSGLEGALASARQAIDATQAQLAEAVRGRQESDARAKQLQLQVEEAHTALERQRLQFAAQQAAWSETARQTESMTSEREKRLLLEVDRERQAARQAKAELLKERRLREQAEDSVNEAKRDVASLRGDVALSQAAQTHAQESARTLQERRDELQKRLASEEESHQSTRTLLSAALAPKSRGKRST